MMDFKTILLLLGLFMLLIIAIGALLGFFAGFKKELKCAAIAFVIVLIAFAVFGDAKGLMNSTGFLPNLLKQMLSGIPASAQTFWECILEYVKSMVKNGEQIFAEGTESYTFLYNVTYGFVRGIELVVGTFIVMILLMIGLGIYRLVSRIVARKKAKKAAANPAEAEEDNNLPDNVVVSGDKHHGVGGVVVATNKEPEAKKNSKHRGFGALVGAIRATIIVILLSMPIAGVCSILDHITPETEELIRDVMGSSQQKTAESQDALDMAIEFKDAYYASLYGKFIEGSQYFFGESFSVKIFDSAFKVQVDDGYMYIRPEFNVLLDALACLNGHSSTKEITYEEFCNALDALKDSKLLEELMPVIIEVAYYYPIDDSTIFKGRNLSELLFAAGQQAAFLNLRNADWDQELETLLDAVKVVYELGVFGDDFNPLTLEPETLKKLTDKLTDSEVVNDLLDIVLLTALNHELVTDKVGKLSKNPDLSEFSWKQEFATLVDMYDKFQDLGITSFENLDTNALISDILNDEAKFETVSEILKEAFDLQLVEDVALELAINYVSNMDLIKDAGADYVQLVKDLAELDWKEEVDGYLTAVKDALPILDFSNGLIPEVDAFHLDPDVLDKVIDDLFDETESFEMLLPLAVAISLNSGAYKDLVEGQEVNLDTTGITWKEDLHKLVDIYRDFLEFDLDSAADVTGAPVDFLKEVLNDPTKEAALEAIVDKLPELSLFTGVAAPIADAVVNKMLTDKAPELANILDLGSLTKEEWQEDLHALVDILKDANEVTGLSFSPLAIDLGDGSAAKDAIAKLLDLNILGDDETKNELLVGALKQFKVFDDEALEGLDLSSVDWAQESQNLQDLVDQVVALNALDGFDLETMKVDFQALLEQDEFVEIVVDALDIVADSELALEVIPLTIDKWLVPLLEKFDDEDKTLDTLVHHLSSEELIEEVKKLVDVAVAAKQLGVLQVAKEGLKALDLKNTEAMHTIIDGILDSRIIKGYEGRLIRIALKITGIFDNLPKDIFDEIDFDREHQLLNDALDKLEVVLKDDRFISFNEEGNLVITADYLASPTTLDIFFDALDILFGAYTPQGETEGSALVAAILPYAIDKFGSQVIPERFQAIADATGLFDQDGEALVSDIRHVIYMVRCAADLGVASFLVDGDINLSISDIGLFKVQDDVDGILTAFFDMHLVKGNESQIVASLLNLAIDSAGLGIDHVYGTKFAFVDWENEKDMLVNFIVDTLRLLDNNDLTSIAAIKDFMANKGYLNNAYYTDSNAKIVLDILDDIASSELIAELLPIAVGLGLKKAEEKGYDLEFLAEGYNADKASKDLKTLVEVAKTLVNDMNLVKDYNNGFTGPLPDPALVQEVFNKIMDLELIEGKEAQLLQAVVTKLVPANPYVDAAQLDFENYDFAKDQDVLSNMIPAVFDLLEAMNLDSIADVVNFAKTFKTSDAVNLLREEVVIALADLLEVAADADIIIQAAQLAIASQVTNEALTKLLLDPADAEVITTLTNEELRDDLKVIAEVLKHAVLAGALQYATDKDIDPINFEEVALAIEELGHLNLLDKVVPTLAASIVDKIIEDNRYAFDEISADDLADINWVKETRILADIVRNFGAICDEINLDSLGDILQFVKNKDFLETFIYSDSVVEHIVNIVDDVVESQLLGALIVPLFEYGLKVAEKAGYDLSFLSGKLSADDLVDDFHVLARIIKDAIDFGAIEYVKTGDIDGFEFAYLEDIVAALEELNILTCARADWTEFAVKQINKVPAVANMFTLTEDASLYADVSYPDENEMLKQVVHLIGELLAAENLESVSEIKQFIELKHYKDINVANDEAVEIAVELIQTLLSSQIARVHLAEVADAMLEKYEDKVPVDISFLEGNMTGDEIADSVIGLVDVAYEVRESIIDYLFRGDIDNLPYRFMYEYTSAILLLEEVPLLTKFNKEITAVVYNKLAALPLFENKLDEKQAADYADVDYAKDNRMLALLMFDISDFLEAQNLNKVSEVKSFVNDKKYADLSTYNEETVEAIAQAIKTLASFDLTAANIVDLFEFALTKVPEKYDVSFMNGLYTGSELASDLKVLADDLVVLYNFGILDLISDKENFEIKEVDSVKQVIASLEEMNLTTKANKEIAALVYNIVVDIVNDKAYMNVAHKEAADFAGVDFAADNRVLQDLVGHVFDLANAEMDSLVVKDIMAFIQTDFYKQKSTYNYRAINAIENLLLDVTSFGVVKVGLVEFYDGFAEALANSKLANETLKEDLSFLIGVYDNADQIAAEVPEINAILDNLYLFGLVDMVFGEDIQIQPIYLENIIPHLENIHLLTSTNKNLAAIAYNKVAGLSFFDSAISLKQAVDFAGVDFAAENALLVDLVHIAGALLAVENLSTISDIKAFVADKTYLNRGIYTAEAIDLIVDFLNTAVQSQFLEIAIVDLFEFGLTKLPDKYDLSFMSGKFTGEELINDIRVLINDVDLLIYFGLLDILVSPMNFEIEEVGTLQQVIASLEELNITTKVNAELAALVYNIVADLINDKLGTNLYHKTAADFEHVNFAADNQTLQALVGHVFDLANAEMDSLVVKDMIEFFKTQFYKNKETYNYLAINAVENILLDVTSFGVVKVGLVELYNNLMDVLSRSDFAQNTIKEDLSFLIGVYNDADEIAAEVPHINNILDNLYLFGAFDIAFGKNEMEINFEAVKAIIAELEELQILRATNKNIAAIAYNRVGGLSLFGGAIALKDAGDFAGVDFAAENVLLQDLVDYVEAFAATQGIVTVKDYLYYMGDKEYMKPANYTDEAIEAIQGLILRAADSKILEIAIVDLFEFALTKVPADYDLSFMSGKFTGAELISDLRVLVSDIDELIEFGILDLIISGFQNFEIKEVDSLNTVIASLEELNITTKVNADLAALVYNIVVDLLNKNLYTNMMHKDAADFANVNFAADNQTLQALVGHVFDLANAEVDKITFNDITEFVRNRSYLNKSTYNYLAINAVENILLDVTSFGVVKVGLVEFYDELVASINRGPQTQSMVGEDLSFLVGIYNDADEIAAEVPHINAIIDNLYLFGLVDLVFDGDTVVNYTALKAAIAELEQLHILTSTNANLAAIAYNKVGSLAPLAGIVTPKDVADFAAVDFAAENALLQDLVDYVQDFAGAEGLVTVQEFKDFVNNKEYLKKQTYSDEAIDAIKGFVYRAADSQLLEIAIVDLFEFALTKAPAEYDLSFMSGKFTGAELLSDVKVLVNDIDPLLDFGVLDLLTSVSNFEIKEVDSLNTVIASLEDLNITTKVNADLAALVYNIVADLLNEKAYTHMTHKSAADFAGVDFAADNQTLQALVSHVFDLANAEMDSLVVKDIQAFFGTKFYQNESTYNYRAINAVENILLDVTSFGVVKVGLVELYDNLAEALANSKLANDQLHEDLSFLVGIYNDADEIAAEVPHINNILDNLYLFGAVDLVFGGEVAINYAALKAAIAELEQIKLLTSTNKNLAAIAYNRVAKLAPFDGIVTLKDVADFASVNFANENAILLDLVDYVEAFAVSQGITSTADAKAFAADKKYLNRQAYSDEAIDAIKGFVYRAADSQILEIAIVDLFEYGLTKVPAQYDVSFMSGKFTGAELLSDVKVLVNDIDPLLEFGILDLLTSVSNFEIKEVESLKTVIASLEDLNITTKVNADLAALVYNIVVDLLNEKAGLNMTHKTAADFAGVNFAADNQALQALVGHVYDLADAEMDSLVVKDIQAFFGTKFYQNESTYNYRAINAFENILTDIVSFGVVKVGLVELYENVVTRANNSDKVHSIISEDLSFLSGVYADADEMAAEVPHINNILDNLYLFGLVEIVFKKDVAINYAALKAAIAELEELQLLTSTNKNIAAIAYNRVAQMAPFAGIVALKDVADFASVDFAAENALLIDLVNYAEAFAVSQGIITVQDALEFVNNKEYLVNSTYSDEALDAIKGFINRAADSQILEIAIVDLFEFGLTRVPDKYDVSFMSGKFTGAELLSDVKVLVSDIDPLLEFGILDLLSSVSNFEIKEVASLNTVIASLEDLNITTKVNADLAALVYNIVVDLLNDKLGLHMTHKSAADFAGVNFAADNQTLQTTINHLFDLANAEMDSLVVKDIKEFLASGFYKNKATYNYLAINAIENLLLDVTSLEVVKVGLVEFYDNYIEAVNRGSIVQDKLGEDISFLIGVYANADEMAAEVPHINALLDNLYLLGVVDVVFGDDAPINYDILKAIVAELEQFQILTSRNKEISALIYNYLAKDVLGRVDASYFDGIDFAAENALAQTIIDQAEEIMVYFGVTTIRQAIDKSSYLPFPMKVEVQDLFDNVAAILKEIGNNSELLPKLALAASAKFLAADNLAGLADFHNIYNGTADLKEDLVRVANILEALQGINVYDIVANNGNYPYGATDVVEAVVKNVFESNYLNNDGRLEALVSKFVNVDLSGVDFDAIDLPADADLVVAAYTALLPILEDPEFFWKNNSDWNSAIQFNFKHWFKKVYADALVDSFDNLEATTLYTETGGAILLIFAPLLKKAFPDFYEAMEVESLSGDELLEDFNKLVDFARRLLRTYDLRSAGDGQLLNNDLETALIDLADTMSSLHLIDGKYAAIMDCVLARLEGKSIKAGNISIDLNEFDFSAVDYDNDVAVFKALVTDVFDILRSENLETLSDVKAFGRSIMSDPVSLVRNRPLLEALSAAARDVLSDSFVQGNALDMYALVRENVSQLNNSFFDVSDIYATDAEMVEDLEKLLDVFDLVIEAGLCEIATGEEINYNQADRVEDILLGLAEVKAINARLERVVNKLAPKLVDYDADFASKIDLANDAQVLADAYRALVPFLLSNDNPIKTKFDIKNAQNLINKDVIYAAVVDYTDATASAIEALADLSVMPTLVRFAAEKLGANATGAAAYIKKLDFNAIGDDEVREDVRTMADIVRTIASPNLLGYVFYGYDAILDADQLSDLFDEVAGLNALTDISFLALAKELVANASKVDLSEVYLASIDVDQEKATIKAAIKDAVLVLNSLDLLTIKSAVEWAKEFADDVKADLQDANTALRNKQYKQAAQAGLSTIYYTLKRSDGGAVVDTISDVLDSQILAKVLLPIYHAKFDNRGNALVRKVFDLHDYNEDQLVHDLALVKDAIRALYESQIHTVLTDKQLPDEAVAVPELQAAVEALCELDILDVKKVDFGPIAQDILDRTGLTSKIRKYVPGFDLSDFDYASVSFKADKDEYSAMVPYIYDMLSTYVDKGLTLALLDDLSFVEDARSIYELSIETTSMGAVYDKGLDILQQFFSKLNRHVVMDINVFGKQRHIDGHLELAVNADHKAVLYNMSEVFEHFIQMGFFGNIAITLDRDHINAIASLLDDSFNLFGKGLKYIDRVASRVYVYEPLPFTWGNINVRSEVNVVKNIAKSVNNIINVVQSKKLDALMDSSFRSNFNNVISKLISSTVVDQFLFPLLEGTFKLLTMRYTDGILVNDGNKYTITDKVLPDLWKLVDAVYDYTGFSGSNLTVLSDAKFEAVKSALEVLCDDEYITINGIKVATVLVASLTSHRMDEMSDKLLQIDFASEKALYIAAIDKLQDAFDADPYALDANIVENATALNGVADALEILLQTELVNSLLRPGFEGAIKKVVPALSQSMADIFLAKLNDSSYDDATLTADANKMPDIIRSLAAASLMGNFNDPASWNYAALKQVINGIYSLELVEGNEKAIAEALINKMGTLSDVYDDSLNIADWPAEFGAMIDALDSLVNHDGITDFNDIAINTISGQTVEFILQSQILEKYFIDVFNDKLESLDLSARVDSASLHAVADWDKELSTINSLIDMIDEIEHKPYQEIIDIYEDVKTTTLTYDILLQSGPDFYEKVPVVKNYYNPATTVINDWATELDAAMNTLLKMNEAHITELDEIVDHVTADIIVAALDSVVLKAAVIGEMNDSLVDHNINYVVTEALIDDVTANGDWDKEVDCLLDLVDLAEDSSSLTNAQIIATYDDVMTTILCKEILIASAKNAITSMSAISQYVTPAIEAEIEATVGWEAELDAIIDTLRELEAAGITDLDDFMHAANANIINACEQSVILRSALITEINNSIADKGINFTVDQALIDSVTDWDAELAAFDSMSSLATDPAALTNAQIIATYDEAMATVLCKEVMIAGAKDTIADIDLISSYYNATVEAQVEATVGWEAELDAIVDVLRVMETAGVSNLDNLMGNPAAGTTIEACMNSVILKQAVITEINNSMTANSVSFVVDEALIDSVTSWDTELAKFDAMSSLATSTSSRDAIVNAYDDIMTNTVLCKAAVEASAKDIISRIDIAHDYVAASEAELDATDGWAAELAVIVEACETLPSASTLDNPINNLTGSTMYVACQSVILEKAVLEKMNAELAAEGIAYSVSEAELDSVNSEAAWDAELQTMQDIISVVDGMSSNTVTEQQVHDLEAEVSGTTIGNNIYLTYKPTIDAYKALHGWS